MLLFNEKNERVNVDSLKEELLSLENESLLSQEDMEAELANYYQSALIQDFNNLGIQEFTDLNLREIRFGNFGKKIFKKIKDFLCNILDKNSTESEIVSAILEALASIIPGGIILKAVVRRIAKFIISMGVGKFCNLAIA